jgi:hypothetical protein
LFFIGITFSQNIKIDNPTRFGKPIDSIIYSPNSIHAYEQLKGASRPILFFYPLEGNNKIHRERINNKDIYYDTYHFSLTDSVFVNGKVWIIDENKPRNCTYSNGYDSKPSLSYHLTPIAYPYNSRGRCYLGLKEGKWTVYAIFGEGFARIEENYKKGVRDGLYTVYGKNDSILYQTTFKNGTGLEKFYTISGELVEEKYFTNNEVDYSKKRTYYYAYDGTPKKIIDPEKHIEEHYRRYGSPLYERFFSKTIINKKGLSEQHEFQFRYRKDGTFEQMKHLTDSVPDYTIYGTKNGRIKKIRPWRFENIYLHYRYKKLSQMGTEKLNAMEDKYYWLGKQK